MKLHSIYRIYIAYLLLSATTFASQAAEAPSIAARLIFTDEKAVVTLPRSSTAIRYSLRTITRDGWGPTSQGQTTPDEVSLGITPLVEGIHILEFAVQPPQSVRFLAMSPPTRIDRRAWQRNLPRASAKLFSGRPFKILAMGDSVTWSGDYESILVRMLERATGNRNISFVDRSYPGRSVDASVREWINDGPPNRPDLGLLMYGLNDQITNVPLDAYLEQYAWIARRLHTSGADCVFLQPTPDIGIPSSNAEPRPVSDEPSHILRTLEFGEALRPVATEFQVPLAETFSAMWGKGGATLEEAARRMWPVFPTGYSNPFHSLIENEGKGDTIHPNVLGHLQIARAVFDSLSGAKRPSHWQWSAQSCWTPRGVVSSITARNMSKERRTGRLEVQPPTDARIESVPVNYDLQPGQTVQFSIQWLQASQPADLLQYPAQRYLAGGKPIIPIVDFHGEGSTVYAATAVFKPHVAFLRERQNASGHETKATYVLDGKSRTLRLTLPADSQVGRIPLVQKMGKDGWAVGELAYVQYGLARSGEAEVNGRLDEWQGARWIPIGESVQARSWKGLEDNRANGQKFYLHMAFRAGEKGLYLAGRVTGNPEKDSFTFFFDPRGPELLGTVGRYFWISGSLKSDGQILLTKGETTANAAGLKGIWQKTESGATLEIFVPYAVMDSGAWPASGDLGISPIWVHSGGDGKRTTLMWSENGHPWTPSWYGVVRRSDVPQPQLPFMVRVH